MSLERKDVRFKLPADIKELLDAIAIAAAVISRSWSRAGWSRRSRKRSTRPVY
jgi:hypothetical protein